MYHHRTFTDKRWYFILHQSKTKLLSHSSLRTALHRYHFSRVTFAKPKPNQIKSAQPNHGCVSVSVSDSCCDVVLNNGWAIRRYIPSLRTGKWHFWLLSCCLPTALFSADPICFTGICSRVYSRGGRHLGTVSETECLTYMDNITPMQNTNLRLRGNLNVVFA